MTHYITLYTLVHDSDFIHSPSMTSRNSFKSRNLKAYFVKYDIQSSYQPERENTIHTVTSVTLPKGVTFTLPGSESSIISGHNKMYLLPTKVKIVSFPVSRYHEDTHLKLHGPKHYCTAHRSGPN